MLIAQISDSHLCPAGRLYQGRVDSNAMFAAAVEHVNALVPRPDLVVFTGDVVDEGGAADYAMARDLFDRLRPPTLLIPGNHDEREAFRACFTDRPGMPARGPIHFVAEDFGPVRLVALDVTVPGEHFGRVDEAAAAWLDARLGEAPKRPTMVLMHQPPLVSHIPFLDPYRCFDETRLGAVLERYRNVERVSCGHVHRFMMSRFARTIVCTAPSTTTTIALRLEPDAEAASFIEPPGFLLHHWSASAGLVTHLVPIGRFPGPYPFA